MKRPINILLLILIAQSCFSQEQTVFNYNYPLEWNYDCQTMVLHNGNYLFSGNIARTTESCEYWLLGYHITKIYEDGTRDTTIIFDQCNQTTYIGWNKSFVVKDNIFFIIGLIYNETNKSKSYLLSLNNEYDTIANFILYDDTITKRNLSMCLSNNDKIAICGQIDSTYNEINGLPETTYTKSLLLLADTNGDILWSKSYSFSDISDGCWSVFYRVIPTYDSGYMAIGITHDFGNRKALVVKTDSVGNQQWYRIYGNGSFDNPGFSDIIATHDSCYVVCGAYTYGETFGGLYPYDGWLVKFDNDGNEIWNKKYRDYTVENTDWRDTIFNVFNGVTELSNGNLALIATSKNGQLYGRKPKFYLLNSVGDSILTKIYETANPWYNPNTIITTNDNGFAIGGSGEFYDWDEINQVWVSSQRIFLIKTDSLGNDTILSDISPVQSKPITEFKLQCYPNPATDEFFVELPQWIEDDVLEIYSTNGSLVLLQTVGVGINKVDICDLQPGMYLARLKNTGMAAKLIVQ